MTRELTSLAMNAVTSSGVPLFRRKQQTSRGVSCDSRGKVVEDDPLKAIGRARDLHGHLPGVKIARKELSNDLRRFLSFSLHAKVFRNA